MTAYPRVKNRKNFDLSDNGVEGRQFGLARTQEKFLKRGGKNGTNEIIRNQTKPD